jgi:hypothetical protein
MSMRVGFLPACAHDNEAVATSQIISQAIVDSSVVIACDKREAFAQGSGSNPFFFSWRAMNCFAEPVIGRDLRRGIPDARRPGSPRAEAIAACDDHFPRNRRMADLWML